MNTLIVSTSGLSKQIPIGVFLAIAINLGAYAQSPTADDFNPGVGSPPYAIAVQSDGRILLGGEPYLMATQALVRVNADGSLDTTFDPGAHDAVYTLVVQADGKILVGGNFLALGGLPRGFLGRLNADGSVDQAFDPEPNGSVACLAVQADGKILVAGGFTMLAGGARNFIGRLNANGTLDSSFNPGLGPDSPYVSSLAVQADGKILVGGVFGVFNGVARANIARLNPNGSLDTSFNPGTTGDYPSVRCLAVQADGRILVGGDFTALGGQPRNRIGRLNADGTVDSGFNPGADDSVSSLAVQTDGRILVAGWFGSLAGRAQANLGRFNPNGSADTGFNPGSDSAVYALAVQADGKILAGGSFTSLGGQPRNYLGRLNSSGPATQSLTLDGSTATWLRGGTGPEVWRTTFDASTNGTDWISVGAGLRISGGWQLTGLSLPASATLRARGFVAGAYDNTCGWFVEASLGAVVISSQPGSRTNRAGTRADFNVMVAGSPPLSYQWWKDGAALAEGGNVSGATTSMLALTNVTRADAAGYRVVVSNSYGSVTSAVATLTVIDPAIVTQPLSQTLNAGQTAVFRVVAGGAPPLGYQWRKNGVDLADGGTVSGVITATLTLSNVFGPDGAGYTVVVTNAYGMATSEVATLTVQDPAITRPPLNVSTNLGATAVFSVVATGTTPMSYQWRKGATDLAGATAASLTLTNVQLVDAGSYSAVVTNVYGAVTSTVATLVVTLADPFNPGASGGYYVEALGVQPDGKILAGGLFTQLGGRARPYFGRVNAGGDLDMAFSPAPDDWVNCLALQGDGHILLGGGFSRLSGQPRNSIGQLTPDGSLDTAFDPGTTNNYHYLNCLAVQPDGKILVGGSFPALWRLNANGTRDGSFNVSIGGTLNCLALQPDGKIIVGGNFTTLAGLARTNLGRLNANGALDTNFNSWAFGQVGSSWGGGVIALAVQPDGKILVGGNFSLLGGQLHQGLGRLNTNGTLDTNFTTLANDIVHTFALQADGKILVGGTFTLLRSSPTNAWLSLYGIGRLNADGKVDATFPNARASGTVLALALQADGKIVVGGRFTSLGSAPRLNIGRLYNTDPASDGLGFNGSTVTWLRGGTGPEVWRTTFDYSTDGTNWSNLGAGTRIAGGWQLADVSVPGTVTLRARGYVTGGHYNASASLVETVASFTAPFIVSQPVSQTNTIGTTAVFTVQAGGTPPLGCQWRKGGTNLAGATTFNLSLTNVQKSDEGLYSVVVTNAFGSVTSSAARLTVNLLPVPVICILPASGSCAGSGHWPDRCPTNLLVIACSAANVTVVCDGSKSYDPEGADLQYAWFNGANWFSTNRVALTVLPLGTNVITLMLDDALPYGTNSASATVEVLAPDQAVGRLVSLVENSSLPPNRQRPLLATLHAALAASGRGDFGPSLNQLAAFEHKVEAQVFRSDPALAQTLIQETERIIDALGCCAREKHRGEVRSLVRHGDKVRLEITGPISQVHLIQASTDLIHWETLGIAVDHGDGSFEFEDNQASGFPSRFYRLVSP